MKTKYALPLVQMMLAATLLWWDHTLSRAANRVCDMAGPSPAFGLLVAINLPVNLPRIVWERYLPYSWSVFIMIAAVGLFWYWIALNVHSWRRRQTVFSSWPRGAQLVVDVVIVAFGLVWGLYGVGMGYREWPRSFTHGMGCFGLNLWFTLLPLIMTTCSFLAWSLVLIFFFGRDFIHCALRKTTA